MLDPSLARDRAIANPIPEVLPVINESFPFKDINIYFNIKDIEK
jgi:hypothetical protein